MCSASSMAKFLLATKLSQIIINSEETNEVYSNWNMIKSRQILEGSLKLEKGNDTEWATIFMAISLKAGQQHQLGKLK